MSLLNIGGNKADQNYRYKMPPIQTKVEGRGNGIKTVLVNMGDVARALHVMPEYPTKFLGISLGANSSYDKQTERAVVNGKHEAAAVQDWIHKFIDTFVLCPSPNCRLPESTLQVVGKNKQSKIVVDCAACGFNGNLPSAHQLCTFILANPPPVSNKGARSDTSAKEEKSEGIDAPAGVDKKPAWSAAAEAEAARGWSTDTSDEAQMKRKLEQFGQISKAEREKFKKIEAILAKAREVGNQDSPAVVLKIFMVSAQRTPAEVVAELRRLQLARGLDEQQKIRVLLESLLDPTDLKGIHTQFASHAKLFKKFTSDTQNALLFIGCIEDFVGEVHPHLLPRTPLILQALYNEDVLDKETLLRWGRSPPESTWFVKKEAAAMTRQKAKSLIDLLENEGDDDDEDEDGEEDEEEGAEDGNPEASQ